MRENKKLQLIFIPTAGAGHFFSTVEVAKLLIDQNEQLSITILVMKLPFETKPISESSHSRIRFVELRKEEYSSPSNTRSTGSPSFLFFFDHIASHKSHVREIIAEITSSDSTHLAGIVLDMFCTTMIDVANEFGVPSYIFFASGAGMLGLLFHLQRLRDESNVDLTEYKDSDKEIAIPTYMNPVPDKVLPSILFDKSGGCDAMLNMAMRFRETKGIIINTFKDLEPHAIQALLEDETIPPVYAIGPILNLPETTDQNDATIKWLDNQPDSSVVFLCFGSMGSFQEDQVKEIAVALERSGCRFLWSLRKPQPIGTFTPPSNYEKPEEVLPEGFLERTAEVGKVIGWAAQAAVLSHPAVGGFVSHCGWNSTLESVWNGVPIATWPLYAEQQINAFQLVKDLKLAVEIKMDFRKEGVDIVSALVIENGIKQLMDPDSEVRSKMKEVKEKSRLALTEGGPSLASLICFLNTITVLPM